MKLELDLKCKICGKVLKNTRSFAAHFRESHKDLNYKDYLRFTHFNETIGICKNCGSPTKVSLTEASNFCCLKCMGIYYHTNEQAKAERYEKAKQSYLKKYGVDNIFKDTKFIKQKTKEKLGYENIFENTEYIQECFEKKYGVKSPMHLNSTKEKIKQTCKTKFGVENPMQSDLIKKKGIETNLKKFGAKYYQQSKAYLEKLPEILEKDYNTKKQNNTFNTSKPEESLYLKLLTKFKSDDIIRQYKSPKYPYNCDFYIKSLDLYIELQGTWTHGSEPYNHENPEHSKIVEFWKSKNTNFYNNAIEIWTIRDVEKRKIAKENNLNYIEVFDFDFFSELNFILN